MTMIRALMALTLSAMLCSCATKMPPPVSQLSLPTLPLSCLNPPQANSFLGEMEGAITLSLSGGYGGIYKQWLDDYAYRAEKARLALVNCQQFVKSTWAENNQ